MKLIKTAGYQKTGAPNLDVPQEPDAFHGIPTGESTLRLTEPEVQNLEDWEVEKIMEIRKSIHVEIDDLQDRLKAIDEAWGNGDRELLNQMRVI